MIGNVGIRARGTGVCMRIVALGAIAVAGGSASLAQQAIVQPLDQLGQNIFLRVDRARVADADAPLRLDQFIDDLGGADFKARASADKALSEDQAITLPMLERALLERGSQMSMDTRLRITSAARGRFAQTPRAAMGIQFWQNPNMPDRVVIERTIPNFDAVNKIEDGDMVLEAGGIKVVGPNAQMRFQSVIVSRDPGDVIPVLLRRGEQKLEVSVKLGRRDELGNNTFITPDIIDRAWRVRSASYISPPGEAIKPPIKVGVAPGVNGGAPDWAMSPAAMMRLDRSIARAKGGSGIGPMVVGGGMPRGALLSDEQASQRMVAGNSRRLGGGGQVFVNMNGVIFLQNQGVGFGGFGGVGGFDAMADTAPAARTLQQELDALTTARKQSANASDKVRAAPLRRQVQGGAGGMGQAMTPAEAVEREGKLLEKQIAAIRAEMAEQGITPQEPGAASAGHDDAGDKPIQTTP